MTPDAGNGLACRQQVAVPVADTVPCGPGRDRVRLGARDTARTDCERITAKSPGAARVSAHHGVPARPPSETQHLELRSHWRVGGRRQRSRGMAD